jgi:acid stress-induced BolA-like protein IbaG/YrbA
MVFDASGKTAGGSVRESVRERLEKAFDGTVDVRDLTGTDNHFEVWVVSTAFEGKTPIERHKLVYAPLLDWIEDDTVHALSVRAYTPTQQASLSKET